MIVQGNKHNSKLYSIESSSDFIKRLNSEYIVLPQSLPNYSYNPSGICGSTAAAMMLRYMDLYVDDDFVPTNIESGNGIALINHLETFINHSSHGSSAPQVAFGISDYLSGKVDYSATYDEVEGYILYGQIADGKPYVIGTFRHPRYGNHWMTGYGYSGGWAIVNDGWGNSGVYINPSYTTYNIRLW